MISTGDAKSAPVPSQKLIQAIDVEYYPNCRKDEYYEKSQTNIWSGVESNFFLAK